MTREHKLAMIVGFALVLVVGVLVSDHLSGARKARMASVDMAGQEMGAGEVDVAFGRRPEPAPTVTIAKAPPVTFDGERRDAEPAVSERPIDTVAANNIQPDDGIHVAENGILGFSQLKAPPATIQTEAPRGEQLVMGQPRREVPPGFIEVPQSQADSITPLGGEREILLTGGNVVTPGNLPLKSDKTEKAKTRTVKEGDTLWSIAADVYGDGKLHKKLAEYNKSRLGSGGQLRIGGSILIPEKNVLLGKPSTTGSIAESAMAASGTTSSTPSKASDAKSTDAKKSSKSTYVVKKGDTLAAIAKRELGSAGRWEEILELNSSDLDDETSIRPGMTIKLPR